jgi:signal transduction histidine kinase
MRLLERNEADEARQMSDDVLKSANTGQSGLRALLTNIRTDPLTPGRLTAALARLAAVVPMHHCLDIRLPLAHEPDVPAPTKEAWH